MKVFVYRPHDRREDCAAVCYDRYGAVLGWHVSSSLDWARKDMARHIPEGADVEWVIGKARMQALIDSGEVQGLSFDEDKDKEEVSSEERADLT